MIVKIGSENSKGTWDWWYFSGVKHCKYSITNRKKFDFSLEEDVYNLLNREDGETVLTENIVILAFEDADRVHTRFATELGSIYLLNDDGDTIERIFDNLVTG